MGGVGNQAGGNGRGQVMGMMRQGMGGGMGGGMMGGMGGGMGDLGGGMGGFQGNFARRTVQVQIQGGKKVAGQMQLGFVNVASELGQYTIKPEFREDHPLRFQGQGR